MRKLFIVLSLLLATPAFADGDNGIGKIVNDDMDLTYIDHVLTGRVGDRPVFAKPLADEFGISVWHRAGGEDFETVFKGNDADEFSGPILSLTRGGDRMESEFKLLSASGSTGILTAQVGDRVLTVTVTSDTVDGHHFVEPHFHLEFDDGATYDFDLTGGKACMGCAIKLSYAIVSMLTAYGAL